MEITPEDLAEIQKLLETYIQYLPIVKSLLEEGLPPLLDTLRPLVREFLNASVEMDAYKFKKLQEVGFSETQAFDLLLSHEIRLERSVRETNIPKPDIKMNGKNVEVTGFFDKLLRRGD